MHNLRYVQLRFGCSSGVVVRSVSLTWARTCRENPLTSKAHLLRGLQPVQLTQCCSNKVVQGVTVHCLTILEVSSWCFFLLIVYLFSLCHIKIIRWFSLSLVHTFSSFIETSCRLMWMMEKNPRPFTSKLLNMMMWHVAWCYYGVTAYFIIGHELSQYASNS